MIENLRLVKWFTFDFIRRIKGGSIFNVEIYTHRQKIMGNVKVFQKYVKGHDQGHVIKIYVTIRRLQAW